MRKVIDLEFTEMIFRLWGCCVITSAAVSSAVGIAFTLYIEKKIENKALNHNQGGRVPPQIIPIDLGVSNDVRHDAQADKSAKPMGNDNLPLRVTKGSDKRKAHLGTGEPGDVKNTSSNLHN